MEGLRGGGSSTGSGEDGGSVVLTKTLDVLNRVREKLLEESDSNDEEDVIVLMKINELVDDFKKLQDRIPGYKQEIKNLRTEIARLEIKIHQLTTKLALPTGQNKNFKDVEPLKSQGEATTSGTINIELESSAGTRSDELSSQPPPPDRPMEPTVPKALVSIDSLPMQQSTESNENAASTFAAGETSSSSSGMEGVTQPTIVKLTESGLPRGQTSSNVAVVDKNSREEEIDTDGQTSMENKDKENSEGEMEYEVEKLLKKRIVKGLPKYLVKWVGWPQSENSWEPLQNLSTCLDLVNAFEKAEASRKKVISRGKQRASTSKARGRRTGDEKLSYRCRICEKRYLNKQSLVQHNYYMHALKQSFVCGTCGKCFKLNFELTSHINAVHLRIRPYPCDVCGRAFSLKSTLKAHLKTRAHRSRQSK